MACATQFSISTNEMICEKWKLRGAANDWLRLSFDDFKFPFGTNTYSTFFISSTGIISFDAPRTSVSSDGLAMSAVNAPIGIVPEGFWGRLEETNRPSCFWYQRTPKDTLKFTWQNVLLNRLPENSISFQIELFQNGNFQFYYDLSRLDFSPTNLFASVIAHKDASIFQHPIGIKTSSLSFQFLNRDDDYDNDADGDGLTLFEELLFGTNPYNRDSDFDGLSDYDEIHIYFTDPKNAYSISSRYNDKLALTLGNQDPISYPPNSTFTIWEHLFYSGTCDGEIMLPNSTDFDSVLRISLSGEGAGDLIIGDKVIPLLVTAELETKTWSTLISRGSRERVILRIASGDISVSLSSDDFCIGKNPTKDEVGFVGFPFVRATEPCIHNLTAKDTFVSFDPWSNFKDIECEWNSTSEIIVSNSPPRSAHITGNFPRSGSATLTYTLSHPDYLSGKRTYSQTARFCPKIPNDNTIEESLNEGCLVDDSEHHSDDHCWCGWNECVYGKRCPNHFPGYNENICHIHYVDYFVCSNLHTQAYMNATNVIERTNVLKIGNEKTYEQIHLDVPDEAFHCCDCLSHHTNYVSATASSRIRVADLEGRDFFSTSEDCDVLVSGIKPSDNFDDAVLLLAKTGSVYEVRRYTVLGLDISHSRYHLDEMKRLKDDFAVPIVYGSAKVSETFILHSMVNLSVGEYCISFENSSGRFKLYLGDICDREHLLLDTQNTSSYICSIEKWKAIERDYNGRVSVVAIAEGECELSFAFAAIKDGTAVKDKASVKMKAIRPPLVSDYNRDGIIDEIDRTNAVNKTMHYFWCNNDTWKDDDAFKSSHSRNSDDNVVNGRHDLLNFLPLAIDTRELVDIFGLSKVNYSLRFDANANIVKTNIDWRDLNSWILGEGKDEKGVEVDVATVKKLKGSEILNRDFLDLANSENSTIFAEFPDKWWYGEVYLEVKSVASGAVLFESTLQLSILDVKEMVLWENLRAITGGSGGHPTTRDSLMYDYNFDSGYVVFVHGYNMNEETDTESWAVNVFKKLWKTGLNQKFIAIEWQGNEGQLNLVDATPNYYGNVQNAFETASALKDAMDNYEEPKWFIAHSLGNMLVSSAIQDYNMSYEKYFMLNAAVAMEAFNTNTVTGASISDMTPKRWTNYDRRIRSSNWYSLFNESDGRRKLTWKNRFLNVTNLVNFYSSEEEVVANGNHSISKFPSRGYSWYKQEISKGDWLLMLHSNEGGWRFNSAYDTVRTHSHPTRGMITTRRHMRPENANSLSDEELKITPFFQDFCNPEIYTSPNGLIVSTNYSYRAELLAYAIPSESYAVGANPLPNVQNCDMATECVAGGIDVYKGLAPKEQKWVHSTFVQRSYRCTHKLYKKIIKIIKDP